MVDSNNSVANISLIEKARALYSEGHILSAVKALIQAVKENPQSHQAYGLLGDIYSAQGQSVPAVENYGQAVVYCTDDYQYKQKLIGVVQGMHFKKMNPQLKGVLIECLESSDVDLHHFGRAWLSINKADKAVGMLLALSKHKSYDSFSRALGAFRSLDGLVDAFFLTGFGLFVVADPDFERWVLFLRRYLFFAQMENRSVFSSSEGRDMVICALSRYCFLTDYILPVSAKENQQLDDLAVQIEGGKNHDLALIAIYGCYRRLFTLDNAREVADDLEGGEHVSQIPKSQIEDYFKQQAIKDKLPQLTAVTDGVSASVQEQYEAFPYPRWLAAHRLLHNEEIEGALKGKKAEILVAGCGTGQEAVQLAYVFPDAVITAVDLSRSSLAYAVCKAQESGLSNLHFYQGDIMALGDLAQRYDYITSAGVLHHLGKPEAGWAILRGLLKADGLMRISLYSRQARWAVNAARKAIALGGIGSDGASIIDFRQSIDRFLKHKEIKNIQNFYDYYNLSECRDLLFHVQEHQFDLMQIKEILHRLELEFCGFYMSQSVLNKYVRQNKDDPQGIDLERWAVFEEKNPDIFVSMYNFWVRAV